MNVTISLSGHFHAFNQAKELYDRGLLQRLITTYPKFNVAKYGIPGSHVKSLLRYELMNRSWNRSKFHKQKSKIDFNSWFCDAFDKAASRHIPKDTDVYIGWASKCEQGLRRAKDYGAVTIVDRGSSHAVFNKNILLEEYKKFNVKKWLPPVEIIEKELREYELADFILIPSEFVRRSFIEQGVPDTKLIKIPYGVDLSCFRPVEKEDDVFRILYVGGMHLRKGVHYLLQAFNELNLPGAELWLIGSKSPEIEPFIKEYSKNVKYFGHVPQAELYKYYSECSLFAIFSIEDGFAMVVSQAMACGLPVITTDNTGGADLISEGKDGFVVSTMNMSDIKEKLLWCYQNPDICAEMGTSAREKIKRGYTWKDYGEKLSSQLLNMYGEKRK